MKIGTEEVELNNELLEFSETSLNEFLKKIGGHHSYYSEKYAMAQYVHGLYEDKHEELVATYYKEAKEQGGTEKLAEATARLKPEVIDAMKKVRTAKYNMQLLWGFLRSIDKANTNALNLSYNMRKEMDKLGNTVHNSPSIDEILTVNE